MSLEKRKKGNKIVGPKGHNKSSKDEEFKRVLDLSDKSKQEHEKVLSKAKAKGKARSYKSQEELFENALAMGVRYSKTFNFFLPLEEYRRGYTPWESHNVNSIIKAGEPKKRWYKADMKKPESERRQLQEYKLWVEASKLYDERNRLWEMWIETSGISKEARAYLERLEGAEQAKFWYMFSDEERRDRIFPWVRRELREALKLDYTLGKMLYQDNPVNADNLTLNEKKLVAYYLRGIEGWSYEKLMEYTRRKKGAIEKWLNTREIKRPSIAKEKKYVRKTKDYIETKYVKWGKDPKTGKTIWLEVPVRKRSPIFEPEPMKDKKKK